MTTRVGVVLIDKDEMLARVYESWDRVNWTMVNQEIWDFSGPEGRREMAETILKMQKGEWRVFCRNLETKLVRELEEKVQWPIQPIGVTYEKELVCKGILMEVYGYGR